MIDQPSDGAAPSGETDRVRVVHVSDGDTIRVRIDGEEFPVRYIGIDAPERDEPLGRDATRANAQLVDGTRVHLERDTSETDQYDRLLRHVWLKRDSGWLLVSADLVRQGLAYAQSYPPDTAYDDVLAEAEDDAVADGLGLWDATVDPTPTLPPLTRVPPVLAPDPPAPDLPANSDCDPSYPTLCLSSSTDLDCGQLSERRFPVVGRDPHGFDGDGDGVGCESD